MVDGDEGHQLTEKREKLPVDVRGGEVIHSVRPAVADSVHPHPDAPQGLENQDRGFPVVPDRPRLFDMVVVPGEFDRRGLVPLHPDPVSLSAEDLRGVLSLPDRVDLEGQRGTAAVEYEYVHGSSRGGNPPLSPILYFAVVEVTAGTHRLFSRLMRVE
jgi:hypothetical protein